MHPEQLPAGSAASASSGPLSHDLRAVLERTPHAFLPHVNLSCKRLLYCSEILSCE